jgi:shikimate dehydrogenase substrate binding domain protein
LGTFPNISDCPPLPYQHLNASHLLYDLIYNPTETTFLAKGKKQGATTCNGQRMLELQAEKAWQIWQNETGN